MHHIETILLVDDEEIARTLFRYILESSGYKILEAANIADAVAILHNSDCVDLLVVDVAVPGVRRPEMQQLLTQNASRSGRPVLPVLYMTDLVNGNFLIDQRLINGNSGWLRKPFRHAELVEQVTKLLRLPKDATASVRGPSGECAFRAPVSYSGRRFPAKREAQPLICGLRHLRVRLDRLWDDHKALWQQFQDSQVELLELKLCAARIDAALKCQRYLAEGLH